MTYFQAGRLTFEWDEAKARRNRAKHHVTFEEAATVFLDPLARVYDDPVHSSHEDRLLLVGRSAARRTLLVVHVSRGEHLRIISAREANPRERKAFEEED
jgi:uncharacterized DUF497 family protein